MENKQELYEPVINFREQRPQILTNTVKHKELYEKAFFPAEDNCKTDYALNTTAWD